MINTAIEWATHTLNFWWGCTKVSQACAHCYAEAMARVFSRGKATWGPDGARWLRFEAAALELGKILRKAERTGVRPRVFVNSMSDTFEANPVLDATRCMALVAMADCPGADFLLLTKRPENVRAMVPPAWLDSWPANVWLGTTVEDQLTAAERVPVLLAIPAAVRFLSCEPLLGPVDLQALVLEICGLCCEPVYGNAFAATASCGCFTDGQEAYTWRGLDWVICGGESGHGARPMNPAWARGLRDQCAAAEVPFFFKQWGEWIGGQFDARKGKMICDPATVGGGSLGRIFWTNPGHPKLQKYGPVDHYWTAAAARIGKKHTGRVLDGREHNEFPEVK